jgi:CO/xanthine dehydrogenase FAD-binding subunit
LLGTKEVGLADLLPKLQRYQQPSKLEDVLEILQSAEGNALVLGGGVSLAMIPRRNVSTVVSLDRLRLDYVNVVNGECRIGASVTLGALTEALARIEGAEAAVVRESARRTATTPLRNLMTVGGVVAGVGPWSDLPVALLVLDTAVTINGEGSISLERLLEIGPGKVLAGKGLITEIRFIVNDSRNAAFDKLGRNATDLALASAAVSLSANGHGSSGVAVAVGGLVPKPVRLPSVEQYLQEASLDGVERDQLYEVMTRSVVPRPDPRAPRDYRLRVAANLVADCVGRAQGRELP